MSMRKNELVRKNAFWRICFLALASTMAISILLLVLNANARELVLLFSAQMYAGVVNNNAVLVRNLVFTFATPAGVILATWRMIVLNRQSEIASRQAAAAEGGHRDGRFEKGAEMMSADEITSRIGGIVALERLATNHPDEYHVPCMKMFSAYVRFRFGESVGGKHSTEEIEYCPPDIEMAAQVIGNRRRADKEYLEKIERQNEYKIDMSAANLSFVTLNHMDFSESRFVNSRFVYANLSHSIFVGAWFSSSNLSGAILIESNIANARLQDADLTSAVLKNSNLSGTNLVQADLRGADLSGTNLANANLFRANLSSANLDGGNLNGANLKYSSLSEALLDNANFFDASLWQTDLSNAKMRNVRNLSQLELNKAFIRKGKDAPDLEGSICVLTGDPLVWQGQRK